MNLLTALDTKFFLIINRLPHTPVSDFIFIFLSHIGSLGIVWFIIGFLLLIMEKKRDILCMVRLICAGVMSFLTVEFVFKPWFGRLRPTQELGAIILGVDLSNSYSFPSGHAAIAWACAFVLARKKPKWRWGLYLLAFFISFSRVFIGKHFPLDVIVGGLLGLGIGEIAIRIITSPLGIMKKC